MSNLPCTTRCIYMFNVFATEKYLTALKQQENAMSKMILQFVIEILP